MTEIQPHDYEEMLIAAINSWLYLLAYILPAAIFILPVALCWRYTAWLAPLAFLASCVGYFTYWQSIGTAMIEYSHRTGYFNNADTWYVFMPIFRGLPNVLFATAATTLLGWALSRRRRRQPKTDPQLPQRNHDPGFITPNDNPYTPPQPST
jgi:hypothetical protein